MGRVVLLLWLYPLVEFAWMVIGLCRARWSHHHHGNSGATEAIIQITTVGNYQTVNEIIEAVREYRLPFPYSFWVVVEPGVDNHYVGADEVIVVPEEFHCLAAYKARAQEYSRRVRQVRGLDRHDVKIIMLDDDSLPTAKYFVDVFNADYDVCEGVLTPRRGYGRFLTHLDDLRTFSCLVVCAFWQGIGHPMWIHGEGLCLRGSAEAAVTWNFPVIASEDLTVGQNAVERGLTWGFVWEYVQLTAPWTWNDFIKQRRRWIWGNIYALRNGLLPPLPTVTISLHWIFGAVTELLWVAALILVPLGIWRPPGNLVWVLFASLLAWISMWVASSWIGSKDEGASIWRRLGNTAVGTLLAPVSSFLTFYVLVLSILKGDPKSFEVIAKANPDLEPVQ